MARKLTIEEFIKRAKETHGDKYKYDKVIYVALNKNVEIFCTKCNMYFMQRPDNHLQGKGHIRCATKHTTCVGLDDFLSSAKEVHGDKYDYSKVNYINATTKIEIICKKHNSSFWQTPSSHLQGHGCPKCGHERVGASARLTTTEFIKKAKKVHGDIYRYDKVHYINSATKVQIFCTVCKTYFYQQPNNHLQGKGCNTCATERVARLQTLTTEEFIDNAIALHGDRYDYSQVDYISAHKKVRIFCTLCGNYFEQSPSNHLNNYGCYICKASKGECIIRQYLVDNNIAFEEQKRFKDCRYKNVLPFDFYLPEYNMLIEYQGRQHYEFSPFFHGTQANFDLCIERDKIKRDWAITNGFTFVEIPYTDDLEQRLNQLF
jgi:hypothetical protein